MNLKKKMKLQPYHKNPDYIEYLEKCKDICHRIYIAQNIALREDIILQQLKEIDKLMANNNGHKD